jgi:hypothetical protein
MLNWMLSEKHAITILQKDHDTVKKLFDDFEDAENSAAKERIISKALEQLKIHAIIEEEVFYPTVCGTVGSKLMNEADEEHHVAKVLIAELDASDRKNDHRDAKFTVLSESVRHHIREEENEMLPKAKEMDIDFEALGRAHAGAQGSLQKNGIPTDAEHALVAKAKGKGDSPAAAAKRNKTPRAAKSLAHVARARASKGSNGDARH